MICCGAVVKKKSTFELFNPKTFYETSMFVERICGQKFSHARLVRSHLKKSTE